MMLDPITTQSFAIIDAEFASLRMEVPMEHYPLVRRAIHSTADFTLAQALRFHPRAIMAGQEALQGGTALATDVNMVVAGLDRRRLDVLGCRVLCHVADPTIAVAARAAGITRSAAGMRMALQAAGAGAIVVVGNAPTALREMLRLVEQDTTRPALVIGVPVGFVDAAESKEALMALDDIPWITVTGRKGGSAVAAALINALLHLVLPTMPE